MCQWAWRQLTPDKDETMTVSLPWDGRESGWTFPELFGPEAADDWHEPRLFWSDTERRQSSLVGMSQIVVRLRRTKHFCENTDLMQMQMHKHCDHAELTKRRSDIRLILTILFSGNTCCHNKVMCHPFSTSLPTDAHSKTAALSVHHLRQEAQLSQRDRAMLHVIEYFAKSFKVTRGHLKWHCWVRRV